jgi:hypothetical protein
LKVAHITHIISLIETPSLERILVGPFSHYDIQ